MGQKYHARPAPAHAKSPAGGCRPLMAASRLESAEQWMRRAGCANWPRMKCASCSTESDGPYCTGCGLPLKGAKCKQCNAELTAGARHCGQCGAATSGGGRGAMLPWVVGGLAAAVVAGYVLSRPSTPAPAAVPPDSAGSAPSAGGFQTAPPMPPPAPQAAAAMPPFAGQPAQPEPQQPLGPRELADALFNDAMTASESGQGAEAAVLLPQALSAYQGLGLLDDDSQFHVALLQLAAKNPKEARAAAERILAKEPKHLLALGVAALAAQDSQDAAGARAYSQRLVDAYPAESALHRPEYEQHARVMATYLERARQALGR